MKTLFYILFISVNFNLYVLNLSDFSSSEYQPVITIQDSLQASIERGAELYTDFCMQCHLAQGEGVPNSFPPLAASNWLKEKRTESIAAVKYGLKGSITVNGKVYNSVMTPMGLEDEEIADIMNYVMNSWGNKQDKMITPEEVATIQK